MKGDNVIRDKWPKIRQYTDKGKPLYQVDARRKGTTGKRESFVDLEKAQERAKELAESLNLEGLQGMAVRPELRIMAVQSERLLAAHGKTIADAVEFYLAHLESEAKKAATLTIETLADLWQKDKTENSNKPLRKDTKRDIKSTAQTLISQFGKKRIAEVTKENIDAYLDGQEISNQTKENRRNRFSQFFNWCIAKKHFNSNPAAEIEIDVTKRDKIDILSIDTAKRIFEVLEKNAAHNDLLPYFALCCFAGLRPMEADKVTWKSINFEQRHLTVFGSESKVKDSRNVDIEDTLFHWLNSWKGEKKGLILNPLNAQKRIKLFKIAVGFQQQDPKSGELQNEDGPRWIPDIMRHSYASYSLAIKKDYGHVAMQMGNSIEIIKKHYKALPTKADAKAYWEILPDGITLKRKQIVEDAIRRAKQG